MRIDIGFDRGVVGDRAEIERTVNAALDHLAASIDWVRIRGRDVNGIKGGVDQLCRLTAHLKGGELITVSDRQAVMGVAAAGVVEKAVQTISRLLARRRKQRYTSSMSGQTRPRVAKRSNRKLSSIEQSQEE